MGRGDSGGSGGSVLSSASKGSSGVREGSVRGRVSSSKSVKGNRRPHREMVHPGRSIIDVVGVGPLMRRTPRVGKKDLTI